MNKLIVGDCLTVLPTLGHYKTILADPPDNIGLVYGQYKDNILPQHYYLFVEAVIREAFYHCDVLWFSYNACHDLKISSIVEAMLRRERGSWEWKKLIWTYTFGQYSSKDFGPCYRPILRLSRAGALFFPDAVREESERMRLGDSRSTGPKVPSDVWEFPRVVGNSVERQAWHPTQFPCALYGRMIRFSGGPVLDLFAGSGTCFRAGRLCGVDVDGIEIDTDYCKQLEKQL